MPPADPDETTGEVEVQPVGTTPGPRPFQPLAQLAPSSAAPTSSTGFRFRDVLSFDLNRDGVPDLKQPWLYRVGLRLILRALDRHPAPRAIVEHLVRIVDEVVRAVQAEEPKQP